MGSYVKIDAAAAYTLIKTPPSPIVLDVRTGEEYKARHIEGAINLPWIKVNSEVEQLLPDKKALILVYCSTGLRSAMVARKLIAKGYYDVRDFGAINEWPYPTVRTKRS